MIATTIKQSKQLLELGIDPKTADLVYRGWEEITADDGETAALYTISIGDTQPCIKYADGSIEMLKKVKSKKFHWLTWRTQKESEHGMRIGYAEIREFDILAWSLDALIRVLPKRYRNKEFRMGKDYVGYFGKDSTKDIVTHGKHMVENCVNLLLLIHNK